MRVLFTGGGTGGHFYPIIAVAEKLNLLAEKEKILDWKLYFMSDAPYDRTALYEQGISFIQVPAGKLRLYFSIKNIFDGLKVVLGSFTALFKMFTIYPDVIFSKGGYASFPALLAAWILRIPVIIHESDSAPGRVNKWAARFARRIAVSFDEAGKDFPPEKTAWVGQPVRTSLQRVAREGAFEYLKLDPSVPVIFIIGGSQGAQIINDNVVEALPELLNRYQIIHQCGTKNIEDINTIISVSLKNHPHKDRYKPFAYLNLLAMRMAAGASSLIISRAGSVIFEIASWGRPSIIIPITNSNRDHQRKNAYNYSRVGACDVIEEANLSPHLLISEINRLMKDKGKREEMSKAAMAFAKPDAAEKIAREIITLALEHEK
ncbi:hypothetical protein A3A09_03630 [Candidatus Nomurabacteria bacterium RIFCSPLOWO2_01_FULL_42_20]|uniref:UDP-N-acetylglucosamine--N-acetylmuramyl-(pentapeptide) pyrophosphoryl-undecaprenol N-acetylglucosamine transferase n=1 Tax=Candidatus Nomurabacteria bacterium RIFCSPHIGHO2_01_FULL_42_16 TaxID=1801743 RepID=A0A1F6VH81_9BACT|nr:MAG: hypothetical protein A2824_02970 [Candidatus Nomurabacteria bacterium RIFCSPHIGHO2_01_FULL_42_16]OGI92072.1 MAG: hypothetical protein A3A09_03630 [Candidatus Nomurabacteria bacterium RIFCSPLOWO2_01_FULL_42_20]